jgi:hypothetical protein
MADELAQGEVETPTQEQPTSEVTPNDSEVVNNEVTENSEVTTDDDRGDLRVPLKEERSKRQELEARLNDPNFIYERARALGLTQEEAQAQVNAQTQVPNNGVPLEVLDAHYGYMRAKEKSVEKYPQLLKDEEDQIAVSSIAAAKKITLLEAADRYYNKMGKVKEEAKVEGINQAKTEISTKEKAQTVLTGTTTSSESVEMERLVKESKSLNPSIQKKAMIKILEIKNKKLGI